MNRMSSRHGPRVAHPCLWIVFVSCAGRRKIDVEIRHGFYERVVVGEQNGRLLICPFVMTWWVLLGRLGAIFETIQDWEANAGSVGLAAQSSDTDNVTSRDT